MLSGFSASQAQLRFPHRLPERGAPHVLNFCQEIGPAQPILVPIKAEPDCVPGECFENVRDKVKLAGGRIRYGWALWEWPLVFIEAEHHAVHEDATGRLCDITPAPEGDHLRSRLFLPDESAVQHPGIRRDNIRQALTRDAQIDEFLLLFAERGQITMRLLCNEGLRVRVSDFPRLQLIEQRLLHLYTYLAPKYTPRGAACYCGSGNKFKHCHGR